MQKIFLAVFILFLASTLNALIAQSDIPKNPILNFKRGIGITVPDSLFSINFRFRMQNRVIYNTISETDMSASEIEARARRLRLRMEGFMLNPKLTYMIQLSFSRGDMDWDATENNAINNSPNVVRDAVIYYRPHKSLTLFFGQTKLPGNRQRVISSGEQQFIDRSIVNATYNIDRDFGFQAHYLSHMGPAYFALKGAITSGEGRNSFVQRSGGGLAYTGRIELLPLGLFTKEGDYFEGDIEREEKVKISLAGGMCYNEAAKRTGGQLGRDLFNQSNMSTIIFDGVMKYKGIAIYGEYLERSAENAITTKASERPRVIYTGTGVNLQASYQFENKIEIAGRYAVVTPKNEIRNFEDKQEVYALNVTKYLRGHRVKLQGYSAYNQRYKYSNSQQTNFWSFGVQMELGI